ncbi:TetR/AcrR family transcriptional regulator [Pseudoxanthomonas sp. CF125]|uniref:TetR/AcrR family transcriptional regulator n=1 Tax=Pseudoxanthomonas sp. CF125 TaxID=1855303 RepID=UPI00088C2F93|nr:TetR/AcrR family transcriptional regulator [Pseudoxanthomonas sp. CF125]SDQ77313.1 transcriptional regulator, TetR family [Pseudoxanthomonas sp. CF125]
MCPTSKLSPTPQRLTDRKRLAILQAAIDEFRGNGFEATSMDRIAATAGVSKRTVYNHFPSKDALFAEILVQLWEKSTALIDLAYRPDRPLREQLLELLRQKLRMLDDANFIDLARVAIAETIHSPERAQSMVARMGNKEEGVTVWIRAALADGRLKPLDPAFAAHQIQGLVKSFAFWPQITMGAPPLSAEMQEQVAASAVDMFLGHYAKD